MSLRSHLLAAFIAVSSVALAADTQKVAAKEAAKLVAEGKAILVDCREPAEWQDGGVAAPAVLLPKSDFDGDQKQWKEFLAQNQGKKILLYCRGGGRASGVAEALAAKGIPAASIGGLKDWTAAGLPTRPAGAPATAAKK